MCVTGNLDNLSDDNLFPPMTHTFPLLDYANATFETVAVNEKETFCEAVAHDTVG